MPSAYKKYTKNNTWNIRLLVYDSFVPSSKQPSVIYCRLTDLKSKWQMLPKFASKVSTQ